MNNISELKVWLVEDMKSSTYLSFLPSSFPSLAVRNRKVAGTNYDDSHSNIVEREIKESVVAGNHRV